jgi:hypothetical protein
MAAFEQWLSRSPGLAALFFVVAAAVLAAVGELRNRQIAQAAALDYEDQVDPVVRTLGLNPE